MTETQPPVGVNFSDAEQNDPVELAKIESDIHQTRNAIAGDLRTLGERLSPEKLKEEAKEVMTQAKNIAVETLHDAKNVATDTFREVKDSAMETVSAKVDEFRDNVRSVERDALSFVRTNAVPLALIGIGVAWFMSNRRNQDEDWEGRYSPRGQGRWRYPERGGAHPLDDVRNGVARAAETTRERGARAKDQARDWVEGAERDVSNAMGQVRDFAEREVEEVRGAARDVSQKLSRATGQARDVAGRELRQAWEYSRRTTASHPLAVAAGAVAAGVCVGLALPETERESELLGRGRERLFDDAKEVINDLSHSAKEAARDVKSSLSGTAG
jgi:ElaB/YqjD/DUF883 family membrane-anchored ribosome-binding protein